LSTSEKFKSVAELNDSDFAVLSEKSFFFAHQSVGVNVVDGLALVIADYPALKLNIETSRNPESVQPGVFLHTRVGENRKPKTKIAAFERILGDGIGDQVDVAFLKFCYIDADQSSSAEDIFESYKSSIEALKLKYPNTTFVHFTMPLRTVPTGWKVKIKNVIGKAISEQMDNAVRGDYNELLRKEYLSIEPVFDIAYLESIALGAGVSHGFKHNGKRYQTLALENTYDGGHLSDQGKRWIAEQLIVFLVNLEYKS